jgi:hypothetical protein
MLLTVVRGRRGMVTMGNQAGEGDEGGGEEDAQKKKKQSKMEDLSFCNTILTSVSRSFAAVIRQLPSIVLVDVMIFYLVLRALDTIEDDMTFFHKAMMKGEGGATDSTPPPPPHDGPISSCDSNDVASIVSSRQSMKS